MRIEASQIRCDSGIEFSITKKDLGKKLAIKIRKTKAIKIISFVTLFLPVLLLLTGCPRHIDSQYGIKVVSDGSGGAFALYEDSLGGNIYVQKISPDGKTLWGEKGVLLGKSGGQFYIYHSSYIVSDGSGGVTVSWPENIYHIMKFDADGNIVWQKDYEHIDHLMPDGSGGIIVDISPDENSTVFTRIDSDGNFPWGTTGISLTHPGDSHQAVSDGSGGAIIALLELRYPEGAQPGETISRGYIYIQKTDSKGQLSWGEEDLLIYSTPDNTYAESIQITGDGSGGAIVAWHQVPTGKIESGSPEALLMDVIVQKIDASGRTVWKEGGLPFEINKAAENALPIEPLLVNASLGGAIIAWRDGRDRSSGSAASLYAQRVDQDGNLLWQAGGVKVSSTSLNPHHAIASDGSGGAYISYSLPGDWKMLHVQKMNNDGKTLWGENGVLVIDREYAGHSVSPDGLGGVVIGWGSSRGTVGSEEAYIQRVHADGTLLWGAAGIKLNP